MVLFAIGMYLANRQYKTKGVAWGRPVAGLCGVMALLIALSRILYDLTGCEKDKRQNAILSKELQYTAAQFQHLGEYMQRKFANHSVLVIASPKMAGANEYADDRLDTIRDSLKDAFDGRLTIADTVHLKTPEMEHGMPPMFETMFTAEAFDEIVADNPDADLILSLVGLPMDWKDMKFWHKEDEKRADLIVTNGQVFELYDLILQDYVDAVVHYNPASQYNFQDDVPSDSTEAFEKRYLLIDAGNIAKIAAENKGMFAEPSED